MLERTSDRWVSIVLSVLLHGALVALLAYGWWTWRRTSQPAPTTLAIEATVVDARSLKAPPPEKPTPAPPEPQTQPQAEPEGPPQPTPDELAQRAQAQKEQEEHAAQEQRLAEQKKAQEEVQRQAEQQRQEEERKARQRADEQRKAREEAEAKKRAEQKKVEDDRRKADEARARAQSEADLRRSLDAEERQSAQSSAALATWQAQITARIQRAWLRPPSARAGIECVLFVTQVPGGEVTKVSLGNCNGDQAVRESIEAAVYRASPLPPPPDPSLFERDLEITFRPTDAN
jgi:colicin import membrane protein